MLTRFPELTIRDYKERSLFHRIAQKFQEKLCLATFFLSYLRYRVTQKLLCCMGSILLGTCPLYAAKLQAYLIASAISPMFHLLFRQMQSILECLPEQLCDLFLFLLRVYETHWMWTLLPGQLQRTEQLILCLLFDQSTAQNTPGVVQLQLENRKFPTMWCLKIYQSV